MTVYVDKPMPIGGRFNNYCHLFADSDAELHAFADRLNLPRTWLQISRGMSGDFRHYDLSPSKRWDALKAGAQYLPLVDWLRKNGQQSREERSQMSQPGKPQRQSFAQAMAHKNAALAMQVLGLKNENQHLREALARIANETTDEQIAKIAQLALLEAARLDDDEADEQH
jgi:hypothetical protein